jgi:hypothetical protein
MTTRRFVTVVAVVALIAALAGATVIVRRLDRLRELSVAEERLYVPSPKVLQRMSLGYSGLLADIYWTRVVQYFGRQHHQRSTEYKLLGPLLDITTTLDPHLTVAYEFGATFLSQRPPEGAGDPDAAVRLVEHGIRENPSQWRLYYNLGFIHYFERKDYAAAAAAFERGSRVPGALPWMKVMAAQMSQHAGELQMARMLWTSLYQTTEDRRIRVNAAKHLRALDVDESVPALEDMASRFHDRNGRWPAHWGDLIAQGYLRGVPLDPTGRPYRLASAGHVLVQVPSDLPFITKGLPQGEPSKLGAPESKE